MKITKLAYAAASFAFALPAASAATIAGADFSDSAVFNAAGGTYDIVNTDDLGPTDNITVTAWAFANGGALIAIDANAQVGMPSDLVTKIDGGSAVQPAVGTSPAGLPSVSFSLQIPAGTTLNLSSVTFDWRQATPTANTRWLAFNTSLDTNLTFSEVGLIRPAFTSSTVNLSGAAYQGLTNRTVTFNWYAGGPGSGDIDFDTVIVNGVATTVPEPSALAALTLAIMGLATRRRR